MRGIVISLLLAVWLHVISGMPQEGAFLISTEFLIYWYIFWSAMLGIFYCLLMLGLFSAAKKYKFHFIKEIDVSKLMLAAGITSVIGIIYFIFRQMLLIGGAICLHRSLIIKNSGHEWDQNYLVAALICILIVAGTTGKSKNKIKNNN
ncbi:MAG: hypothetical protein US50_C0012G0013 [Candidatus Nomurabacteria bacterium GW2011_GWB1_37_5]|uniref:Uncharacterized protein n=1 Tax=Candidatus Nomurabacteria bacterium GW2011_GWB1_37_5 TaxID=1618742 RepID=A0A0G0GX07_9BACT|nr:MAG: hypothetical protein US50_C0012G0013 [Candidatus Nomurabacteria bacterium GW2011_GWB1_37_5]